MEVKAHMEVASWLHLHCPCPQEGSNNTY